MGHSEIALNALFGAAALPVADDHNFLVTEPRHSAGHSRVVAERAISVNLAEIGKDPLDKIHRIRPLWVARRLNSLPRRRNRLRAAL